MLFYPAALPLSRQTLTCTAGIIRRHRRQIGSPWRKLNPGPAGPAGPGLPAQGRHVRRAGGRVRHQHRHRLAICHRDRGPAGGPVPEAAPGTAGAKDAGHAYLVIDGTLIPIDRVAADRPFYSGNTCGHGMNLQVIASPGGDIVWVSGPLPGAVHDLTAAWIWGIVRELAATGLVVLADKGYHGAGPRPHPLPGAEQARVPEGRQPRARPATGPGERANAQLKTWRILRKLRCCPWRAGHLAKAIHVLQARETGG